MGGFACLGTVYSNQNVRVKSWSNTSFHLLVQSEKKA